MRNGRVSGVRSGAGEAGALNGNTSTGVGGHLYVGFGSNPTKSGSVGVKAGYNRSTDEGMLALTDVDGDNLPDKVFERGDGFVFRKNLSRPNGQPKFAESTTALHNLPGILRETAQQPHRRRRGIPRGRPATRPRQHRLHHPALLRRRQRGRRGGPRQRLRRAVRPGRHRRRGDLRVGRGHARPDRHRTGRRTGRAARPERGAGAPDRVLPAGGLGARLDGAVRRDGRRHRHRGPRRSRR
ncbi:hypothetical protein ACRJ4W_16830 [Streptomyces sp. GLT-R25]